MRAGKKTYNSVHILSSVFMMLALLWLTVSTPFVFASQQQSVSYHQSAVGGDSLPVDEEGSNPFGNSTEEKTPGGVSLSEEYLHGHHSADYYFHIASYFHKLADAKVYVAFHGEMLVPPPNAA